MVAHELSHENWDFGWIYINIDKPTAPTFSYKNILLSYNPIHEIVISPAQIVSSKCTISYKAYRESAMFSSLLLFFLKGRTFLKIKLLESKNFFSKYFVEYRRFECQYLRSWNNGLIYWIIMYFENLFWRGWSIKVERKSTKVSIFMPLFSWADIYFTLCTH